MSVKRLGPNKYAVVDKSGKRMVKHTFTTRKGAAAKLAKIEGAIRARKHSTG